MHANAYVVLIVSDCTKVLQLHLPANANVCDNYDNYDWLHLINQHAAKTHFGASPLCVKNVPHTQAVESRTMVITSRNAARIRSAIDGAEHRRKLNAHISNEWIIFVKSINTQNKVLSQSTPHD